MITGTVNRNLEAVIHIVVIGPNGQRQTVMAIGDTGFSGDLTLPKSLINSLGLAWLGRQPGILADGTMSLFDVYVAAVEWDGQRRLVEIDAVDSQALLGMSLLHRHSIRIDVVDGGAVEITAMN